MSDFNENVNIFSWVETFWKRSYSVIREENNLGSKYYVNLMLLFIYLSSYTAISPHGHSRQSMF